MYLVLIVRVQLDAALLGFLPMARYRVVLVGLMYDLWDKLRSRIDHRRVWCRQLCPVDGICGGIFEEQGEEREHTPDQECDDEKINQEKYDEAPSHGDSDLFLCVNSFSSGSSRAKARETGGKI